MYQLSQIPQALTATAVLAVAVMVALAAHALIAAALRRALAGRTFALTLLARTSGPGRLASVVFVIAILVPALPFGPALTHFTLRLLGLVFIVLLGWIALAAIDLAAVIYLMRFGLDTSDNLLARKHVTQVRILKRVASTLVVIFTIGAALMTFNAVRQYGVSLFASAGVAGLVVGFAARPVFSNLIAGLQLAITQPIRIDDAVIVENESGVIEEITSTYVVVRIWDLRRMIVPLTYFIEKPFQNWSRESTELLGTVLIHADYSVPVERVRKKLEEIVQASALWNGRVCTLQVTGATERTVELRALVSANAPGVVFNLRCEVREKLIAFLRTECPEALPRDRAVLAIRRETPEARGDGHSQP